MSITIVVATHKAYWMPEDPMYLPLHVGRAGKAALGYTGDDTGENISSKNSGFCELTGLYWAWKHVHADFIGLVHYRRYFSGRRRWGNRRRRIARREEIESALDGVEALVPRPRHYWIETNYSQYAHAHHARDLDLTREIIRERSPADLAAFDRIMKRTYGRRFNMLVMRSDVLDAYCTWLFDILFELERRIDDEGYDRYNARVFGFIGERLLDVFLETRQIRVREMPYVCLEPENWMRKGFCFVKRKLTGGKNGQRKA